MDRLRKDPKLRNQFGLYVPTKTGNYVEDLVAEYKALKNNIAKMEAHAQASSGSSFEKVGNVDDYEDFSTWLSSIDRKERENQGWKDDEDVYYDLMKDS